MKHIYHLIRLGSKFQIKYAEDQGLQQIIENAATYGEGSMNGIMNFPQQLKKDHATLSIDITINKTAFSGYDIKVSQPIVYPPQFSVNYSKLADQIKNYLDKNIRGFTQIDAGTITLKYSGINSEEVANR